MLGYNPFYFRTIRKLVVSFGSLFNSMVLVKYTNDTQQEVSRLTVPLSYSKKENFLTRLLDNSDLAKPIEISLPRAAFEIKSYTYAPARKLSTFNYSTVPGSSTSSALQQYQPVPWDIGFELNIMVRNVEDGTQLIEQIVPFFSPDYTIAIDYVPEMGIVQNTPIILNGVSCDTQYEGDAQSEERIIIWTLSFTVQANFYGPVISGNLITQANTNFYSYPAVGTGESNTQFELILDNTGLGNYQFGEVVYQGANLPDSYSRGVVELWDTLSKRLVLSRTSGTFIANANVTGSVSQASWGLAQTTSDILQVVITNTVTPNTANINSAYGFDTVITEFPSTI